MDNHALWVFHYSLVVWVSCRNLAESSHAWLLLFLPEENFSPNVFAFTALGPVLKTCLWFIQVEQRWEFCSFMECFIYSFFVHMILMYLFIHNHSAKWVFDGEQHILHFKIEAVLKGTQNALAVKVLKLFPFQWNACLFLSFTKWKCAAILVSLKGGWGVSDSHGISPDALVLFHKVSPFM